MVSTEMELDSIERRLAAASTVIFLIALFTLVFLVLRILEEGVSMPSNAITFIIVIVYFVMGLTSYNNPLISYVLCLIIYGSDLVVNFEEILSGHHYFLAYRFAVPVILVIGICNVFFSWYQISNIKKKELQYPEDVKRLEYIVKDRFVYTNSREADNILNNIDAVELVNDFTFINLKNGSEYISYSIPHHSYSKTSNIYLEKPVLPAENLVVCLLNAESREDAFIFLSILTNIYSKDLSWIDKFLEESREKINHDPSQKNRILFISEITQATIKSKIYKDKLYDYNKELLNLEMEK